MCGIVGWSNLKNNIRDYSNIMEEMIDTLKLRGPDSAGLKTYNHALILFVIMVNFTTQKK